MNQRGRQLLAMAAITGGLAGCTSDDHLAADHQALVNGIGVRTFNPEMPLMIGYNSLTDAQRASCVRMVKAENCADDAPRADTSGVSDELSLELVTSRSELKKKLGIDANLSVRYKVVEASASVNIEQESEFSANTITFLLKGETSYWTTLNQTDYQPELKPDARTALDEEDKPEVPSQFFVKCGDSWTTGYQRGAQFYVLLTITTSSRSSRESLEARLKAELTLPVVGAKAEVGVKMAKAASDYNASVKLKVRADGFQWAGAAATNAVIEAALSGQIGGDTFKKFVDIHDAMQQSINNDRCIDRGFSGAKLNGTRWDCVNDAPSPGKSSHVLRINVNDYATVGNLPRFDDTWKPLVTYQKKVDQARKYIAQLDGLEDNMLAAYYDEVKPYLPRTDAERSMYGLAPPQILPRNDPFFKLADQDHNVNYWADRFRPPGGTSVNRVHSAGKNCWAGVTRAEFDGCTCPGKVNDVTDRCLASLDAYRQSWTDLFNYREKGRVLPLQLYSSHAARTFDGATADCAKWQSTMISYDEAQRSALCVANLQFGQPRNTVWRQNTADAWTMCPQSWYTPAQQATYIRPIFQNQAQNVVGGQDRSECWRNIDVAGVLCVPAGGLFALNAYPDRLQALPRPPPQVVAIDPALRAVGQFRDTRVTLVFSGALDADTVNVETIKLKDGATALAVELAYTPNPLGGGTVVLTPSALLDASKTYTVEVGTGVKGVDGDALLAIYRSTFTVANWVATGVPAGGATGVALDTKIDAGLAAPANPATVTATTMQLWRGNTQVTGAVSYAAATRKATFTPAAPLEPSTTYTIIVDGMRDPGALGNPVAREVWSFTTGVAVVEVHPAADATDVDRGDQLTVRYSADIGALPPGSFTLKKGAVAVPATASVFFGSLILLAPTAPLEANTRYTATVTTAITDKAGKPVLTSKTWSFTTGTTLTPTEP